MNFVMGIIMVALIPLIIIDLLFIAEMLCGLPKMMRDPPEDVPVSAAVVIPAHNESAVITRTLAALRGALDDRWRVLVIADNCSDQTASIARSQGAIAIERKDPFNRGKGFALAFARDWLRSEPPEFVVVLDADCHIDPKSLRELIGFCKRCGLPVQAVNLLEPDLDASPLVQISSFAFLIKNLVRQRGLQRLTGSVHLTGTGMCLPWSDFDRADLATSDIVEDVRLGIALEQSGAGPQFAPGSVVWSPHASQRNTLSQRQRWEGGFMSLASVMAPALLSDGLKRGNVAAILRALDLTIPPLAVLALANGAAIIFTAALAFYDFLTLLPAMLTAAMAASIGISVITAWWMEGRQFTRASVLLQLPFYVVWKIPMYLALARHGAPRTWRRTERPDERDRED